MERRSVRGGTVVLARTRFLLETMHDALAAKDVAATILMRRDDFLSPQIRWLVACLKQIARPLDRRNMAALVDAFGNFGPSPLDWDGIVSRSEADQMTWFSVWVEAVRDTGGGDSVAEMVDAIARLSAGHVKLATAIDEILGRLQVDDPDDGLKDDISAWRRIKREIGDVQGLLSLDRFLQELQLRSKEPVPESGTVSLATIHSAKGLEFDTVYLIGMAEEILPSWHSLKREAGSAALEGERRACFVAVTRAEKQLVLSCARHYRGRPRQPSRFLTEMGCLGGTPIGHGPGKTGGQQA